MAVYTYVVVYQSGSFVGVFGTEHAAKEAAEAFVNARSNRSMVYIDIERHIVHLPANPELVVG